MMNQYDSLVETMLGMNVYNLPMPVTPPTDLLVSFGSFASRYLASGGNIVGFNRRDNPFVRSLGFFSNMGDGLVDNSVNAQYNCLFTLDRFAPKLSGTISNVAGTNLLTGVGTSFSTELALNTVLVWLDDNGVTRIHYVSTITDDFNLVLDSVTSSSGMFAGNTTLRKCNPCVLFDFTSVFLQVPALNQQFTKSNQVSPVGKIRPIIGMSTFPAVTPDAVIFKQMTVLGVGTRYLRDVSPDQIIHYGSGAGLRTLRVIGVDSDTQMRLTIAPTPLLPVGLTYPAAVQEIGWMDDILGIRFAPQNSMNFATISIDPGFGPPTAKRLAFHGVVEIEHSFPLAGTLS